MLPRRAVATLLVTAVAAAAAAAPARAAAPSDPRAVEIADQVMQALGGRDHWDALVGLRWSFGASVNDTVRGTPRRHSWNKRTGEHRVEGALRDGTKFCFIHTLGDTLNGKAWMNGRPVGGDSLHTLLKNAEAMWVNDEYWLCMPYKLRDPGVTLQYDGETKDGDVTYDKLSMTFDHVGLTPGDHYWLFVNRANHRIERWEMVLEGQQPPPVGYTWDGWTEHDGLWFASAHRSLGGPRKVNVFTDPVETVSAFRPDEFRAP